MTPQQSMMNDALSPHTPSPLPADGGGLCRLRRISVLRSTRHDAQMNYLSTLSIFMKQTTYLATLPNQVRKLSKSHRIVATATYGAARVSRDYSLTGRRR
jgi:hypothetical protein